MREIVSAKNNEEDYFIVHKLLLFQIIQSINQSKQLSISQNKEDNQLWTGICVRKHHDDKI